MKKNKILQGILLIAIALNYGCETDANVIVPAAERKLVVGGFLSSEENEHQISLTQSDPLFSSDPPISLANVQLTISSDSINYSPTFDFISGTFQFNNNQFKIGMIMNGWGEKIGSFFHCWCSLPHTFPQSGAWNKPKIG